MVITEFTQKIVTLSSVVPFSVTSWGRSKKHNLEVGGNKHSRHRDWLGIDIILDNPEDKEDLFHYAIKAGLKYLDEGDHIHLQV